MSKFSVRQSVIIDVPESFRKEIMELCDVVEMDSSKVDILDVLNLILEANPEENRWNNWDNSIVVNFVEDDVTKGR